MHPALVRTPTAHVDGHVLADAEHEAAPAHDRQQGEQHRVRVRPEHPDGVDFAEQPPEATDRDKQRSRHGQRIGEALVVRQADQLGLLVQRVVRRAWARIDAPDEDEPVDVLAQLLHEHDERPLAVAARAVRAVLVVGVGGETHSGAGVVERRRVDVLLDPLGGGARVGSEQRRDGAERHAEASHPGERADSPGEVHRGEHGEHRRGVLAPVIARGGRGGTGDGEEVGGHREPRRHTQRARRDQRE